MARPTLYRECNDVILDMLQDLSGAHMRSSDQTPLLPTECVQILRDILMSPSSLAPSEERRQMLIQDGTRRAAACLSQAGIEAMLALCASAVGQQMLRVDRVVHSAKEAKRRARLCQDMLVTVSGSLIEQQDLTLVRKQKLLFVAALAQTLADPLDAREWQSNEFMNHALADTIVFKLLGVEDEALLAEEWSTVDLEKFKLLRVNYFFRLFLVD